MDLGPFQEGSPVLSSLLLQKEDGVGVSFPDLIHLCSVGHLSRSAMFPQLSRVQAALPPCEYKSTVPRSGERVKLAEYLLCPAGVHLLQPLGT